MPCYDPPSEAEIRNDARHNSDVAEMLCALCRRMEKYGTFKKYADDPLRQWWKEHQKRDRDKAREARRSIAREQEQLEMLDVRFERELEALRARAKQP